MRLQILHVHDCPNVAELEALLVDLVGNRTDVEISRQLVEDDEQAAELGMAGSPTLLINGADAFAGPLDTPSFLSALPRRRRAAGCRPHRGPAAPRSERN